jgi:hypothetical protein
MFLHAFAETAWQIMPNNRIINWGIVVLVATMLLWIGAELTKRIAWA